MANFFKKKGGGQIATSGIQMNDVSEVDEVEDAS